MVGGDADRCLNLQLVPIESFYKVLKTRSYFMNFILNKISGSLCKGRVFFPDTLHGTVTICPRYGDDHSRTVYVLRK